MERLQIIIDPERENQNGDTDPAKNLKVWEMQLKIASRKVCNYE